jgi:hypothetical protein
MLSLYMCNQLKDTVDLPATLTEASFNCAVNAAAEGALALVEVTVPSWASGLIEANPRLTMLSPAFCANAPEAATAKAQAKEIFEIVFIVVSHFFITKKAPPLLQEMGL